MREYVDTDFVIIRTALPNASYHLRKIKEEKGKALCGAEAKWDTKIPIAAYQIDKKIHEIFCSICASRARGEI